MHKLVTFVQLVLYWYNGFSQSVVMESDLFLRISVWENRDTCHNIVRRQIASDLKKKEKKKGDCSLMDTCCGITTRGFFFSFFMDAWLSPTNKHMAEMRKISALPEHSCTYTHIQKQAHLKTPFCLAVVFVSLRPKPPIVELTAKRGVGGWSHSARATPAQKKKPQHKLTLGRGWRGSIFPKADYLPSP